MDQRPVALQLYTLREQLKEDFAGTLRAVARIGYAGVELAGYGGLGAGEIKALLGDLGLRVAGDHVALNRLEGDLDAALDFAQEIGNQYVVCPSVPEARRRDAAAWRQLAGALDGIGRRCRERGLHFCYHNHAFEFAPMDGSDGFALLFDNTDPQAVQMELDAYWAQKADRDPAAILRRYPGRCPIVHLKDMAADVEQSFAEVGEGTMNFQAIFDAADTAGVAWYVVEQDRCKRPPLESVELSLRHLREWGMA